MKPAEFDEIVSIKERLLAESNKSSTESVKQIILIDSAALALFGALASTDMSVNPLLQIFATIAILFFVFSACSGVASFLKATMLFRVGYKRLNEVIRILPDIKDEKRIDYYNEVARDMNGRPNNGIWVALTFLFFLLGLTMLSSIIVITIWS